MLSITIPDTETYDEVKNEFNTFPEVTLLLEHSLSSISKWESKWKKVFCDTYEKTKEESLDYIRCMITNNDDPDVIHFLTHKNINDINKYIDDSMTATWFKEEAQDKPSKEKITAELIYYWMLQSSIPLECEHWHFNRLITLIKVCSVKNQPEKKRSPKEIAASHAATNAERRAQAKAKAERG